MLLVAGVFLVTLLLGFPLAFVLGFMGLAHLFSMGNPAFFNIIPQRLFAGIDNISLTCIPFFIVAGEIMNVGGVTTKLMDAARDLVGHKKGGLAYTSVIISAILSAIIGAAQAVASILCSILLPEMKKDGYNEEYSGALISAASVLGPIIPPSVIFVVYAASADVSIKGLFMAGVIPGLCIALGYSVLIFYQSRHMKDFPEAKGDFDPKRLLKSFVKAIPALMIPVIIIGGIMGGIFTTTESGAVAVIAAILAGFFYKTLDIRKLPGIIFKAGLSAGSIYFVISLGNILGWTMAVDDIPGKAMDLIFAVTSNPSVVIFMFLMVLVAAGCVLDITSSMLIFTPVMAPIALACGVDPVHWGVIFCITLTIGFITPPVGQVLFVTSNISKVSLGRLSKSVLPFCAVAFIVTFVLAYLPDVVLFLPNLLAV